VRNCESRTADGEGTFREASCVRAPMRARKYIRLTTMTKTWEHEFAVERMRKDPTISYRALAKVLGISDSTIRQWRDDEGIQPRPHHNTGRSRNGTRSTSWSRKPARPDSISMQHQDDDGYEDDEGHEEDEEVFEPDDSPVSSHATSLMKTWETIGQMGGLFPWFNPKATSPRRSRTGASTRIASPTPEEARGRLRAIAAQLRTQKPRGPAAVKLLVEAAPYLTGGVNALAQNGEAWGCVPEDISAAERIVVARRKG
jgi:hypothetical protein